MKAPTFESEAAMCGRFIEAIAKLKTWTAYPETAGWDILLAHKSGCQIGIQAKLQLNTNVVSQALEDHYSLLYNAKGPDFRAVLVPAGKAKGWRKICDHLGITVLSIDPTARTRLYTPDLPLLRDSYFSERDWFDLCPSERCTLPEYIPDVTAGSSAPVQLTDWKIRAIKICVLIEKQGYVCRADFVELKISISRWLTMGWLRYHPEPARRGAFLAYKLPDFRAQHPRNYAEIEADFEKWKPKTAGLFGEIPPTPETRETVQS